jgi:lysophospholipase L1-like esterase/fibronectin type 3 domain-containing protein
MHKRAYWIWLVFFLLVLSCGGGGGSAPNNPPAAPQNVVSSSGDAKVSLSWDNSSDATTYNIYWSTTAGVRKQTGTKISAVSSPYYHNGLTNDTLYYYVVTAANQYGESSESREVTATPSPTNPPLPPSEVATLVGDRRVIIRWSAQEAAETTVSHNLYWSTSAGVTKASGIKITGVTNPYTHTDLMNGTTYYYVVTSVNEYGEGGISREVSATPDQGNVPSAPTGLSATAGNRQAVVSWTAVSGLSYNLYWSTSSSVSSKNGTKIANVTGPYTHTGLTYDITYHYVLTAENGYGESADSARASVTIPNYLQDVCVAMGDSITRGTGVDNYANVYVPRLSAAWGKTVHNEGVDKALSSYGAGVIDDILAQYNPKYITIYYGTNDSGFYDNDWIVSNLRYIIQRAKENGTKPVVATLGPFFGQWAWKKPTVIELNQKIRQMAAEEGVACADLDAALDWNSAYINSDGMHPNSAGHRVIANTFYGALTR